MQVATGVIRAFQLLFAVVVLGISVTLARDQVFGDIPAQTEYAIFTGGFGILAVLVGIVAMFVESLEGVVTWALDGLAALAFLAGGIAYAVALRGTDCSNAATLDNKLLTGGCKKIDGSTICGVGSNGAVEQRCRAATADSAFMLLGFIMSLVVVAFTFFKSQRS